MTKKPVQRQSQFVTTFGPGAMIDLPTRSILIGGLNRWSTDSKSIKTINEPVLTRILEDWLRDRELLDEGRSLALLTPPVNPPDNRGEPTGVDVTVFPTWFVVEEVERRTVGGQQKRARRIVQWRDLADGSGRQKFERDDGKKVDVSPLRFVGACPNGHIQDIDWRRVIHGREPCEEPMWLVEQGSSANLTDLEIVCDCQKSISMRQAMLRGTLGRCDGRMPWLSAQAQEDNCVDERGQEMKLRLLTRSATNAYFPLSLTVVSMPTDTGDKLDELIERHWEMLKQADSLVEIEAYLKLPPLRFDFEDYDAEAIFERVSRQKTETTKDTKPNPRKREFDRLACGEPTIGENTASSWLYAETLPQEAWVHAGDNKPSYIASVVAVHRIREVMALYGFTRFEAPPSGAEAEIEDINLATRGAPLAEKTDWLPAVEQFGEGIFLHFDPDAIHAWRMRPQVSARLDRLVDGYKVHKAKYPISTDEHFPGGPYVLLHSIAHALMIEIALDCGYPQSSLKERIYAMAGNDEEPPRYGVLIYTASLGAQGTLGGLVATATRICSILEQALERMRICSNDPVCADHAPGATEDERSLLGAACHGCLLVPETSCERRNYYLDRALIVATMANDQAEIQST